MMTMPKTLNFQTENIPKQTRILRIELGAYLIDPSFICIFDNIQLNIFHSIK